MNDSHNNASDAPRDLTVGDQNVERLLRTAYDPEPVAETFAERVRAAMHAAAAELPSTYRLDDPLAPTAEPPPPVWKLALAAAIAASVIFTLFSISAPHRPNKEYRTVFDPPVVGDVLAKTPLTFGVERREGASNLAAFGVKDRLLPKQRPAIAAAPRLAVGDTLETADRERRRVSLPDGSRVLLNEDSKVRVLADRRLALDRGTALFEVAPQEIHATNGATTDAASTTAATSNEAEGRTRFVVETPEREVIALGTKFVVDVAPKKTDVVVVQGKVAVAGLDTTLAVGEQTTALRGLKTLAADAKPTQAPRATAVLDWARDLYAAASPALVPESEHAGGALVVKTDDGQETRLSMRKYHVDVHIEDGFARTTIDQTYFNHLPSRQEGTFFFPLPADASISRLAMYVAGKLMEGGMAERQHAAEVFESIKRKMQDPALLEWIDGTTFRMRVFPLEGLEEKRIVLSYTQRLPSLYGKTTYRFPAGHNLGKVGLWTAKVHVDGAVADGAEKIAWRSPSHTFAAAKTDGDLTLTTVAKDARLDRDVVVELTDAAATAAADDDDATPVDRAPRFATAEHENSQYYMIRQRPQLPRTARREHRDWILLVETSADRDPLLARAQVEIARGVLEHVEHDDTFTILAAAATTKQLTDKMPAATVENARDAVARLEDTQLLGALDLSAAFAAVKPIAETCQNPYLVHLGGGQPVLGERETSALGAAMPARTKYIGVGVGKRWNRPLMKLAASKTGGYFTQINPDENIAWRSLDLVATLNAPRLLDVKVADDVGRTWLAFDDAVADGEEVCAVVRLDDAAPNSVTITGSLDGQHYRQSYPVENVAANAGYLPRMWAKLEIDRLVAEDAAANKDRITELSKAMYVMSPFTSLLVLENEDMYKQYHVDRGRKDHWAMYPCPDEIDVVRESLAPNKPPGIRSQDEPQTELEAKVAAVNAKTLEAYQSTSIQPRLLAGDFGRTSSLRRRHVVPYRLNDGTLRWKTTYYTPTMGRPGLLTTAEGVSLTPYSVQFDTNGNGLSEGERRFGTPLLGLPVDPYFYAYGGRPPVVEFESLRRRGGSIATNGSTAWGGMRYVVERAPILYPDAFFWEELQDRNKLHSSVDFTGRRGEVALQGANPVVTWAVPNANFGDLGYGFHWTPDSADLYWPKVDSRRRYLDGVNFAKTGSPPPLLWSTHPLDIDPIVGQVDWLGPPPASTDLLTLALTDDFTTRLAGLKPLLGRVDAADDLVREQFADRYLLLSQFGGQRGVAPVEQLWDFDGDADGRSDAGNLWIDPVWYFTGKDVRSQELQRLELAAKRLRDLIREEKVAQRHTDAKLSAVDDNLDVQTLRGPVRVEYLEELDKLVVTGNPQDTETVLQLVRQLDESRMLGAQLTARPKVRAGLDGGDAGVSERLGEVEPYGDVNLPGEKLNLVRQPLQFPSPATFVHSGASLLGYAPGMFTTAADIRAVIEEEVPEQRPTLGKIDAAARKLIDRARSHAWQEVTIPLAAPYEPLVVSVDGAGRYRYTRHTDFGLGEEVICDGEHEWRLYDELGIGAKRAVSRYHRAAIGQLVPWLVPPAEDLAVGGDVVRVDDHTVAVVREVEWEALKVSLDNIAKLARPSLPNEPAGEIADRVVDGKKIASDKAVATADDDTTIDNAIKIDVAQLLAEAEREQRVTRYEVRLVFAAGGRLAERQWLVDGKLLLKVTYAADGRIAWRNAQGDLLAERKLDVRPGSAPSLVPDTRRLVVLPLPWRRWGTGPTAELKNGKALDYPNYTDDEAMAALAAFLVENDASAIQNLIAQRYFGSPDQVRGKTTASDRRLGFYMILALAGCNWQPDSLVSLGGVVEKKIPASPLADHPDSPVAWLLARELADRQIGHPEPPRMPSGSNVAADKAGRSLAATLVTLRRLYPADDPATETVETAPDQVAANVLRNWQSAHELVANTRSPLLAMAALQTMQQAAGKSGSAWTHVALGYERWRESPAWSSLARYESARAWFKSGDRRRAQDAFSAWYAAELDTGRLPLVDDDFRMTFHGPSDDPPNGGGDPLANHFSRKLLDAAKTFSSRGQHAAAILVAWQAYQFKLSALGDAILHRALAAAPSDERAIVAKLAAVAVLYHTEQWDRADELLAPMLDDARLGGSASLWRLAADLAERRGRIAVSVARWERVAELEYQRLGDGDEYEVAAARQPFETLMRQYDKLVTATVTHELASGQSPSPSGLVARIVRTADRWRTLDSDATAACLAAAKVLSALGQQDLAWQYATTPLAQQDATAAPYATIAAQLAAHGVVDLALRAYDAAEAADRYNAQLLWDRAQLLESHGRFAEARETYRRLSQGRWPAAQTDLKRQAAERVMVEDK